MSDFRSILKPTSEPVWKKPSGHSIIRSQFRIETLMLGGAVLQSLLTLVLPLRLAVLPAAIFLLLKVGNVYAIKTGLMANPYMKNVIMHKHSAQAPDSTGAFGNQPARDSMAVLFLSTRSHSATGLFDGKFKEMGDFFQRMNDQLNAEPAKHGFLGSTLWTSASEDVNPHMLNIMYFTSAARVHDYAHSPLHREAWNWWYKNISSTKQIGIMHELYEVPSGNYESVYAQMEPVLAGLNQHRVTRKTDSGAVEVQWQSPLVDASRGQLRTSKGRMARSSGTENDQYGHAEPYTLEDGKKN